MATFTFQYDLTTAGVTAFIGANLAGTTLERAVSTGDPATDIALFFDGIGDTFLLGSREDWVWAGNGDDTIFAGADLNADNIKGGGGNDIIEGGWGGDTLDGGDGSDWLYYRNAGGVTVNLVTNYAKGDGGYVDIISNFENVTGSDYNDVLTGNQFDNELNGNDGNDKLTGNGGVNILRGGLGDDIYVLGNGADTIIDSAGYDTVRFTTMSTINFEDGFGLGDPSNDLWSETFIERFEGSAAADLIILTIGAMGKHDILGKDGNDILGGNADVDFIDGGAGNDFLYGRDGFDTLVGGTGNDELYGDAGADTLTGGWGNDVLDGGAGSLDTAVFSDHFGDIYGGWLFDLVNNLAITVFTTTGGQVTEQDTMISISDVVGSRGNDTFLARGRCYVNGFTGYDHLFLQDSMPFGTLTQPADDRVNLELGISERGSILLTNPERVTFENIDVIHTGIGNDTVIGSTRADVVYGDDGNDDIGGAGANDKLYGGAGADILRGEDGADLLYGGQGADQLIGGDGTAVDLAMYDDANYGNLIIRLDVPSSNTGAAAGDTYTGIEGIVGGNGDDQIFGNAAGNVLRGGAGADDLWGGNGRDTLTGGSGADSFVFHTAPNNTTNFDRILDFEHGIDKIELASGVFTAIGMTLEAGELKMAATATDNDDFLLYDASTGKLYYDSNANVAGGRVLITIITHATVGAGLDIGDFTIL